MQIPVVEEKDRPALSLLPDSFWPFLQNPIQHPLDQSSPLPLPTWDPMSTSHHATTIPHYPFPYVQPHSTHTDNAIQLPPLDSHPPYFDSFPPPPTSFGGEPSSSIPAPRYRDLRPAGALHIPSQSANFPLSLRSPYDLRPLPGIAHVQGAASTSGPSGYPRPSTTQSNSHSHSPFNFPPYLLNPPTSTTSVTFGDRVLRSPHPPLTALLHPSARHLWPPPLSPYAPPSQAHEYRSSPLEPAYANQPLLTPIAAHRPISPYIYPSSNLQQLYVPPPLQFRYSVSPSAMPRKPSAISSTPHTLASSSVSSRHHKLSHGVYKIEQTVDSIGRQREILVIDDSATPDGPPRKRTRAAVAAEQAAHMNGHSYGSANGTANGNGSLSGASGKKRKVDDPAEFAPGKKAKPKTSGVSLRG